MKYNSNAPVKLLCGEDCTRKAKAAGYMWLSAPICKLSFNMSLS